MSKGEFKRRWSEFGPGELSEQALTEFADKVVDEAAKDISDSIEAHIKKLVAFWKSSSEPYAQYYIDAYCCIRHNVLEDDAFKLKKWFGEIKK